MVTDDEEHDPELDGAATLGEVARILIGRRFHERFGERLGLPEGASRALVDAAVPGGEQVLHVVAGPTGAVLVTEEVATGDEALTASASPDVARSRGA